MPTKATRRVIRNSVFLVPTLFALGTEVYAADFNRQTFLTAMKERVKTEPALMDVRSPSDPILQVGPFTQKTTGWQKDLMTISGMRLPLDGQSATFGVALAYLASQELGISLSSSRGDALLVVDDGTLYHRPASVMLQGNFSNFAGILLRSVFDEGRSCSIQSPVLRGTPAESRFANSICQDLKQVLVEAKTEFKDQQILTSEAEAARIAIQRSQDLLKQAPGYGNREIIEAAIASLESSITGNDLNDIRSKVQALTNASRDLEQFVAGTGTDSLATARQAAQEELTKTQVLQAQAAQYKERGRVAAAQHSLEQSLAGQDFEDIKAKTQTLEAADRELHQFISERHSPPEANQIPPERPAAGTETETFSTVLMIAEMLALLMLYFLPSFLARHRRNRATIFVLNVLAGWTVLGWIVALVLALQKTKGPVPSNTSSTPTPSCKFCKGTLSTEFQRCPNCGADTNTVTPVAMAAAVPSAPHYAPNVCTKCRMPLALKVKFCAHCGTYSDQSSPPPIQRTSEDSVRQCLRQFTHHGQAECIECGYSGYMGLVKQTKPLHENGLFKLLAFMGTGPVRNWYAASAFMGGVAKNILQCPSCGTTLEQQAGSRPVLMLFGR